MSTTGASFASKTMMLEKENQSIKFEIWDTAGQERYRSLAKVFYKNASVCILVYDITRRASFDELKKYLGCPGPISWDDKRPGCYILSAIVTKEEKRM